MISIYEYSYNILLNDLLLTYFLLILMIANINNRFILTRGSTYIDLKNYHIMTISIIHNVLLIRFKINIFLVSIIIYHIDQRKIITKVLNLIMKIITLIALINKQSYQDSYFRQNNYFLIIKIILIKLNNNYINHDRRVNLYQINYHYKS